MAKFPVISCNNISKLVILIELTIIAISYLSELTNGATCSYPCTESYTQTQRYKEKCKWWGKKCTRYRTITLYRTKTCYRCCNGWTGAGCNTAICSHGCQGRGTCVKPEVCSCRQGFTPPKCDDINECLTNNGGCQHSCTNTIGSYDCKCNSGYQLKSDRRSCTPVCFGSTTCPNGGSCDRPDYCSCQTGFSSPNCQDIDECKTQNGGCSQVCTNTHGSFQCSCDNGFALQSDSKTCEDIDECKTNNGNCEHECNNTIGSYICSCRPGFELDIDKHKCKDIDECLVDNGGCSQICDNEIGSYHCSCKEGYILLNDSKTCQDIDECAVNNGNCSNGCKNTPGSYHCFCPPGFHLDASGLKCQDTNECLDANGGCDQNCHNTIGSFHCSCKTGYKLQVDGKTCKDIDECLDKNGGCQQICTNVPGSYSCSCKNGYILNDDRKACTDINECKIFNGGCDQICVNTPGSFICKCNTGFQLDTDKLSCVGKDFCSENNGGCEQYCSSYNGKKKCSCRPGYILSTNKHSCLDIDECTEQTAGCSHICINTIGSYQCKCPIGFEVGFDQRTCQDVNECDKNNGGCDQICENSVGSFSCKCRSGFKLDQRACKDINECLVEKPCEDLCTNTIGSYQCSCLGNKTLDSNGKTCSDHNACVGVATGCQQLCISEHSNWHCACQKGYELQSDNKTCSDINECLTNNGECSDVCVNTIGSYECRCNKTGHVISSDKRTCIDVCKPNPCNYGKCIYLPNQKISCNCTGTGFTGEFCETGEINVKGPKLLDISRGNIMTFYAKPSEYLIVKPTGDNLVFSPKEVTITHPQTLANVSVKTVKEGEFKMDLSLSGPDAKRFKPFPGLDLFSGDVFTRLRLPRKNLPKGCFKIEITKCPDGTKDLTFTLSSTSPWYALKTNRDTFKFTFGIVFIESAGVSLPVSLIGLEVESSSTRFHMAFVSSARKPSDGYLIPQKSTDNCLEIPLSSRDIKDLMYSNAFARQYLLSLYNKLPAWIRLTEENMPFLSISDMKSDILLGTEVQKIASCEGAPLHDQKYYSVFQFRSGASLTVLNKTVSLISKDKPEFKFCLIVDICQDMGRTIILMFPPGSRDILKNLDLPGGIAMDVKGIGLSLTKNLNVQLKTKSVRVWTGDEIIPYKVDNSASLWFSGRVRYNMTESNMKINASADTELFAVFPSPKSLLTHVFLEEWHAFLKVEGGLDLDLQYKVLEKERNLVLKDLVLADATMYSSIGGLQERKVCAPRANPSGIFFAMSLAINPFAGIPFIGDYIFVNRHQAYGFLMHDPKNDILAAKPVNLAHDVFDLKNRLARIIESFEKNVKLIIDEATDKGKEFIKIFENDLKELLEKISSLAENVDKFNLNQLSGVLSDVRDFVKKLKIEFDDFRDHMKMILKEATKNVLNDIKSELDDIKERISGLQQRVVGQVTAVMSKKSGWGLKYRTSIEIFSIEFSSVELEVVYSANYIGQCNKYKSAYELLKGEEAFRGYGIFTFKFEIYWWLSVDVGSGLEVAYGTDSKNFVLRFVGRIGVFGILSVQNDVYISKQGLMTGMEARVWDFFRARLVISSKVNVPWKKISLKAEVLFLPGPDSSFEGSLGEAIIDVAKRIGGVANERLTQAQEVIDELIFKLKKAQKWLDEKKAKFASAKKVFDSAVEKLKKLEQKVESLKEPYRKAIAKLNHYQDKVNKLCKIRDCRPICIPGFRCRKACKRKWKIKICYPRCSKSSCMIKLPNVPCYAANLACRAVRKTAYLALGVAKQTVRVIMHGYDVARGAVRVAAFVVDKSKVIVDVALLPFDVAKVAVEAVKVQLKGANLAIDGVKLAIKGALKIFELVMKNLPVDVKKCGFSAELTVADRNVFDVSCELNIFKTGWRNIRLRINFKNPIATIWEASRQIVKKLVKSLGLSRRVRRSIDFSADQYINNWRESLEHLNISDNNTNKTVNITDSLFIDNSISSLNISGSELRIEYFKQRCKQVTGALSYFDEAFNALRESAAMTIDFMKNNSTNNDDNEFENLKIENEAPINSIEALGINTTEAMLEYNMTRAELDAMFEEAMNSDEVQGAYNYTRSMQNMTNDEDLAVSEDYPLVDQWLEEMENLTVEEGDSECTSFFDCAIVRLDNLRSMYEGVDPSVPNVGNIKILISDLEKIVLKLIRNNETMTVNDVYNRTMQIKTILDQIEELNSFCIEAPEFVTQPRTVAVLEGETIRLTCVAKTQKIAPTIQWIKDGSPLNLTGANETVLVIQNSVVGNSGKYTCKLSNIVANLTSEPAIITIETIPELTGTFIDKSIIVYADYTPGINLFCPVTGIPEPEISWFVTTKDNVTKQLSVAKTTQKLNVKADVDKSGTYWCKGINSRGFVVSNKTEILVKLVKLGKPALEISFKYIDLDGTLSMGTPTEKITNSFIEMTKSVIKNNDIQVSLSISIPKKTVFITLEVQRKRFRRSTIQFTDFEKNFNEEIKKLNEAWSRIQFSVDEEDFVVMYDGNKRSMADRGTLRVSSIYTVCPAGYVQSKDQHYICVACPLGTYRSINDKACVLCPNSLFTNYQGSTSRDDCTDTVISKKIPPKNILIYVAIGLSAAIAVAAIVIGAVYLFNRRSKIKNKISASNTWSATFVPGERKFSSSVYGVSEELLTDGSRKHTDSFKGPVLNVNPLYDGVWRGDEGKIGDH